MAGRRASERCTREKLHSPGRPSAWLREHRCRFWESIARGRSSEEAAVDAGISTPLGPRWFRSSGGMPPTHLAPSAPALSGRFLTFREREEIAIELATGSAIRAIARKLGRSPSTISREVRRNAATRGGNLDYRASVAQRRASPPLHGTGRWPGDRGCDHGVCTRSADVRQRQELCGMARPGAEAAINGRKIPPRVHEQNGSRRHSQTSHRQCDEQDTMDRAQRRYSPLPHPGNRER